MKGIQFWAQSYCRSTLAFYAGLAAYFDVPFRVCTGSRGESREVYGWKQDEFGDYDVIHTDYNPVLCDQLFDERAEWHQVFGTYQVNTPFVNILSKAASGSGGTGICSEAPLNMHRPGVRRLAKSVYLRLVLPIKVRQRIRNADFFINFSGTFVNSRQNPGWPSRKIVDAGYFPPPLRSSTFRPRSTSGWKTSRKTLFVSGGASWHRGTDLLADAMERLRDLWDAFQIVFAGRIPSTEHVESRCKEIGAPVVFEGFVDYHTLIQYYESCHAFLALGREEPWGVRVNDALHCGAPLIVCDGMGASKIIRDHACGLVFRKGSAASLAEAIRIMIGDPQAYEGFARNSRIASNALMPERAAAIIGLELSERFPKWRKNG
jgi:glycosyltransferase involved in cell wall biosynthesis